MSKPATRKMEAYKKAGNREDAAPKHEIVHFPGLMSEKRGFGDFRTVLHTGLYSKFSSFFSELCHPMRGALFCVSGIFRQYIRIVVDLMCFFGFFGWMFDWLNQLL